MGNASGKFSDQDSYIQELQTLSANNNQAELNATLAENDYLRAKSAFFAQQSVTRNIASPFPNVSVAAANTVGAALGGIGQQGTPSEEPGGGGNPCFLGETLFTLFDGSVIEFEALYKLKDTYKHARSFDENNQLVCGEIEDVFKNTVYEYMNVTFDDGSTSDVVGEHRYYVPANNYVAIKYLLDKCVENEVCLPVRVESLERIEVPEGIDVYNAHIKTYQNYCADRKRVHNLKPLDDR